MADVAILLLFLVLSLCLSGSSSHTTTSVPAADAAEHEYTFVSISSLKPKAACTGHRVSPPHGDQNATWLRLSLSHGPCSPSSHRRKQEPPPSLAELLRQDELRVQNIQMALLSAAEGDGSAAGDDEKVKKHPAKSTTTVMEHGPVVDVNVGSANSISTSSIAPMATGDRRRRSMPGTVQTMVVDTSSDVPWVQCHPPPTGGSSGFFDPTRSPTYAAFPCASPACARLGAYGNGCINGQCQYRVTYPDGSSTLGTYSSDLLTITRATAVRGFQFGCSQAEQGPTATQGGGGSSGTMSLGGGSQSLVSQTAATHGNAFSYCVPPTPSDAGFFVLGMPPPSSRTTSFVATPMLRFTQAPTLYRVLLRGITVAGQPLGNVPAAVFAAGSVMDSRTAVTRLPPTAYQALRATFRSRMGAYRLAPPRGSLDTCYDFTGVMVVRVPRVALLFDRNAAAVELDASGILLDDCLAFAPNADDRAPGIIGYVQQQTIEVLYDVGGRSVGFRRGAC